MARRDTRQWARARSHERSGRTRTGCRYFRHDGYGQRGGASLLRLRRLRSTAAGTRGAAEAARDADRIEIEISPGSMSSTLGRPATRALAELAGIASGTEVIDVGAGLGGPARFVAARFGAHVTAVEPTARFRMHAPSSTAALASRTRSARSTAARLKLPVADASMDVAWMQAVAISVANNVRWRTSYGACSEPAVGWRSSTPTRVAATSFTSLCHGQTAPRQASSSRPTNCGRSSRRRDSRWSSGTSKKGRSPRSRNGASADGGPHASWAGSTHARLRPAHGQSRTQHRGGPPRPAPGSAARRLTRLPLRGSRERE